MTPLDVFIHVEINLYKRRWHDQHGQGVCSLIQETTHDIALIAQCQQLLNAHRPPAGSTVYFGGYWWPLTMAGTEERLRVVRAIIASLEAPKAVPDPLAGLSSDMLKAELARREQVEKDAEAAKVRQITGRWVRRGTERGLLISMPVTEILRPIFEKDFGNLHVPASVYVVRYCGLIAQWPIADCVWAEREGF